jgi:hypothetical protein
LFTADVRANAPGGMPPARQQREKVQWEAHETPHRAGHRRAKGRQVRHSLAGPAMHKCEKESAACAWHATHAIGTAAGSAACMAAAVRKRDGSHTSTHQEGRRNGWDRLGEREFLSSSDAACDRNAPAPPGGIMPGMPPGAPPAAGLGAQRGHASQLHLKKTIVSNEANTLRPARTCGTGSAGWSPAAASCTCCTRRWGRARARSRTGDPSDTAWAGRHRQARPCLRAWCRLACLQLQGDRSGCYRAGHRSRRHQEPRRGAIRRAQDKSVLSRTPAPCGAP